MRVVPALVAALLNVSDEEVGGGEGRERGWNPLKSIMRLLLLVALFSLSAQHPVFRRGHSFSRMFHTV